MYLIPIAVGSQVLFRCAYVKGFHTIERIFMSVVEREHEGQCEREYEYEEISHTDEEDNENDVNATPRCDWEIIDPIKKLTLELNDASCALAAGTGFGGMHAILLYGTLLADQVRQKGTLLQPSCTGVPSIIPTSFIACLFTVLDVIWMVLCFYGMRRLEDVDQPNGTRDNSLHRGGLFRRPASGKTALWVVVTSHTLASFSTAFNVILPKDGCRVTLPCLSIVVVATLVFFWVCVKDWYMPVKTMTNVLCYREMRSHYAQDEKVDMIEVSHHHDD